MMVYTKHNCLSVTSVRASCHVRASKNIQEASKTLMITDQLACGASGGNVVLNLTRWCLDISNGKESTVPPCKMLLKHVEMLGQNCRVKILA